MSEYEEVFDEEEGELLEGEEIYYYMESDSESADEIPDDILEEDINMEAEVAPWGSHLCDVVVRASDDSRVDGNAFFLADQHELAAEPSRLERPQIEQRKAGGRSRGVRLAECRASGSHWVRGQHLVEVYLNDDELPDDLKENIKNVVAAREAREASASARQRRLNEEAWMDADEGMDEVLYEEGGSSSRFHWSSMATFSGQRENFQPTQTGPVVPSANAYEAFRQYWDNGILEHIVTETNRYARGIASSSANFAQEWYDTNIHEILVLFAFWMMLGIIRMPTITSCFTNNPLMQTSVFRKMFRKHRYVSLCRALHFADNSQRNQSKLHCFGPILDHLNKKFKEAYVLEQEICLDESLILWKGKLSIRQYIRTKAARYGVKSFELCESKTGYLWSFFLYEGADTTYDHTFLCLPKSTSSVLQLIRPLLNKGYTLFMDNWFNSPLLARYLKNHKTDCVGTLRANRHNVPPLLSMCKLYNGQFVARHSGDVVVMAYQDKKHRICTISTYHGVEQGLTPPKPYREPQYRPQVILDYNKNMGGVDRKDQMLESYLLERKKGLKWSMKVFKRLLNSSILNARIHRAKSAGVTNQHLAFRLELVDHILKHHLELVPKPKADKVDPVLPGPSKMHVAKKCDVILASGRRSRRRCVWCIQRHAPGRTSFECGTCKVPLCLGRCFEKYHQKR